MRRYLALFVTVALAVAVGLFLAPYMGTALKVVGIALLAVLAVVVVVRDIKGL